MTLVSDAPTQAMPPMPPMQAPFPWMGGKRRVASVVWERFGDVKNYVEPFFGSGAVLLGRPTAPGIETVNDLDGFVANVWRALQADPEGTAEWADWPVNECDLHARHLWLVAQKQGLAERLMGDPDWYDAKIAGWWLWGMACWIGGGFCLGRGPWISVDGVMVNRNEIEGGGDDSEADGIDGVKRQLVHIGDAGRGVHRKRVHLGEAGRGVHRKRVHLGNAGRGADEQPEAPGTGECGLLAWFEALAERLQNVRVCCGDWMRVCGPTPTHKQGLTGVFLDPPYSSDADRTMGIYAEDSGDVAHDVRAWAIENGGNPKMRIALCGYAGEGHDTLVTDHGWTAHTWKAVGGYSNQGNGATRGKANAKREVIWFSPHCLPVDATGARASEGQLFEA